MKKFLLFVSTVFFSLFLVNNKVYAQVDFPVNLIRIPYSSHYLEEIHQYTYEYTVEYILYDYLIFNLEEIDYYFITRDNQYFRKPLDNRYHSYELEDIYTWVDYYTRGTLITLRVTVDKRYFEDYYPEDDLPFFRDDSALYVNYYIPDPNAYNRGFNDGYEAGYNIGYDDGKQVGYDIGYNEGYTDGLEASDAYQHGYDDGYDYGYLDGYFEGLENADPLAYERGYNDGYEEATNKSSIKFMSNIQVWLVPTIIIVVIAGIFVGYRRERYGGD